MYPSISQLPGGKEEDHRLQRDIADASSGETRTGRSDVNRNSQISQETVFEVKVKSHTSTHEGQRNQTEVRSAPEPTSATEQSQSAAVGPHVAHHRLTSGPAGSASPYKNSQIFLKLNTRIDPEIQIELLLRSTLSACVIDCSRSACSVVIVTKMLASGDDSLISAYRYYWVIPVILVFSGGKRVRPAAGG